MESIYAKDLHQRSEAGLETFIRIFDAEKNLWHYINPATGSQGLPEDFFIWYYGDKPLLKSTGVMHPMLFFQ